MRVIETDESFNVFLEVPDNPEKIEVSQIDDGILVSTDTNLHCFFRIPQPADYENLIAILDGKELKVFIPKRGAVDA